jgi:uncharacterized protein YbjT (DUF2867 family)
MTNPSRAALILGGSGRTGSLAARHLPGRGIPARTASRHGSSVFFDWDDPATYPDALAWVMQNFTGNHLPVINATLAVPSGGGSEAFVDAADIAAPAAETLLNPGAHAGAGYALTGPQALAFGEVAAIIAAVSGRPVWYKDIDQEAWISGAIAAGVPADYGVMLRWLTGAITGGDGSQPAGDVESITGRPPGGFEAFARRNAAAWITPEGK